MAAATSLGDTNYLRSRPEGPDPRFLQAVFGFVFLAGLAAKSRLIDDPASTLLYSGTIVLLTTLAAFGIRGRHAHRLFVAVAILDIAAAGCARTAPESSGLGMLALLPVLWLGYRHGRTAMALGFFALFTFVSLPAIFFASGFDLILPAFVLPPAAAIVLVAATRMTERVDQLRVEAEVRTAQLGAVMSSVSVGVMVLDRSGQITSINPRGRDIMELADPTGSAMGHSMGPQTVFERDGVTALSGDQLPTARAARGEEFDDLHVWFGPDPLTRRAVSITSRRLRGAGQDLSGQVMVMQDITELLLATQARDRFLSAASHELRTPLMIVSSHADLLATRPELDPADFPEVAAISRGAERLSRLVADILRVAELPSDHALSEGQPVDLVPVVRDPV